MQSTGPCARARLCATWDRAFWGARILRLAATATAARRRGRVPHEMGFRMLIAGAPFGAALTHLKPAALSILLVKY